MSSKPVVLIVENDPACRDLYKTALSGQDVRVGLASEGSNALYLLTNGLACTVIVTDDELPDMDGFSLIEEACRFSPASTKIMISARKKNEISTSRKTQCNIQFLTKPINVKEFMELVASAIDRSQ